MFAKKSMRFHYLLYYCDSWPLPTKGVSALEKFLTEFLLRNGFNQNGNKCKNLSVIPSDHIKKLSEEPAKQVMSMCTATTATISVDQRPNNEDSNS